MQHGLARFGRLRIDNRVIIGSADERRRRRGSGGSARGSTYRPCDDSAENASHGSSPNALARSGTSGVCHCQRNYGNDSNRFHEPSLRMKSRQ
jgi:hypothetical protein